MSEPERTLRPAVFLDRDGTIMRDVEYPSSPKQVELIDGAAAAIRRLNEATIPVIVVTNQSGIARGLFTLGDYERVRLRLNELLAEESASIDATYFCPHHPDHTGPCECRKPGTLLYRKAAHDHDLSLGRSYFVGDRWRDVAPSVGFGGRGILVPNAATPAHDRDRAIRDAEVAQTLGAAVDRILYHYSPVR